MKFTLNNKLKLPVGGGKCLMIKSSSHLFIVTVHTARRNKNTQMRTSTQIIVFNKTSGLDMAGLGKADRQETPGVTSRPDKI